MSPSVVQVQTLPDLPQVRVIKGQGDLDEAGMQEILRTVEELAGEQDIRYFVLDFQQLTFLNSKGLGYLILLHNSLSSREKQMVLTGKSEFLHDLINMVGVVQLIPYFESVEQALTKIRRGEPLLQPSSESTS